MRLAYLGSPAAAVPPLQALLADGHEVKIVVTQPDRRRGRGAGMVPTPVKAAAMGAGLRVTGTVDDVLDAGVELGVVVAFGKLIKPHVLEQVPMINLHFSLLPRWRGAAPVERAILAGDTETGVCVMALEEGLDTGPVYRREVVTIGADETAEELRDRLVEVGTRLLVDVLREGLGDPEPQVGEATYAAKIDVEELRLDWDRPAAELHRLVRIGRAWTTFRGRRLRVLRARLPDDGDAAAVAAGPEAVGSLVEPAPGGAGQAGPPTALPPGVIYGCVVGTGDGRGLELVEVQPEGKPPMPAPAWLNGARPHAGERLGQ